MSNRRMIYSDLFEDEFIGVVEIGLRLLWIGLIVAAADDQGRMLDNTALIRAKVFTYDIDISDDQIDIWLEVLADAKKIVRYSKSGKNIIQIVKWWNYQSPAWASDSKFPEPDGWYDRVKVNVGQRKVKMLNWDQPGGFQGEPIPASDKPIKPEKKVVTVNRNGDLFDQCVEVYEKKKGLPVTDGQAFTLMINNFKQNKVTAKDYAAAIDAMDADPKYTGDKPTSYESWAIGYAKKRLNPIKITKDPNAEKLKSETYKNSWGKK